MLTKDAKKVLDLLIESTTTPKDTSIIIDTKINQCLSELNIESSYSEVLEYLEKDDFLKLLMKGGSINRIVLSHKAKKYKEFERAETFDFIKKSFVFPILVSVVTTIIVSSLIN